MKAIERGIFNDTTQTRMNQLEQQLADIQGKITLKKFKERNLLTKEKVVNYLTNSVLKKPKQMIQTLVRKIVVYEDKIEIYYNYTDETNPEGNNLRDSYLLSGSDSSVILGGHGTNTNPNKKNYPGSDSSVMVEINGFCRYPEGVPSARRRALPSHEQRAVASLPLFSFPFGARGSRPLHQQKTGAPFSGSPFSLVE